MNAVRVFLQARRVITASCHRAVVQWARDVLVFVAFLQSLNVVFIRTRVQNEWLAVVHVRIDWSAVAGTRRAHGGAANGIRSKRVDAVAISLASVTGSLVGAVANSSRESVSGSAKASTKC